MKTNNSINNLEFTEVCNVFTEIVVEHAMEGLDDEQILRLIQLQATIGLAMDCGVCVEESRKSLLASIQK